MRSSTKNKIDDQIFEESKIELSNICKFQDSLNFEFSSPIHFKNQNYSILSTTHSHNKTKRIIKRKQCHHVTNHPFPKDAKLDNEFSEFESNQSPERTGNEKQVLTLEVNQDIKSYYELLDLAESLDALIIKYYKDPLLSTILMDSHANVKPLPLLPHRPPPQNSRPGGHEQFSNVKIEEGHMGGGRVPTSQRVKLQQYQQGLSEHSQSQFGNNQQHHNNLQKDTISPNALSSTSNPSIRNDATVEQALPNPPSNLKLEAVELGDCGPFVKQEHIADVNIELSLYEPDLHEWLSEVAVFVDKFSPASFRKLFRLKQTLNSIEGLVNKTVKKQLDSFHFQLQQHAAQAIHPDIQRQYAEQRDRELRAPSRRNQEDDHHVCRICWQYFANGHQLGGHMSKKHPGHSLEYRNKELIKTRKVIERERRLYFRAIQKSAARSEVNKMPAKGRKR